MKARELVRFLSEVNPASTVYVWTESEGRVEVQDATVHGNEVTIWMEDFNE